MNIINFLTLNMAGVYWNPVLLVILFCILLLIVVVWGRIFFRRDYNRDTGQVKPFNSGLLDEVNYNVQSSNLYWGFRKALDSLYKVMIHNHDGDLNNYLKWMVIIIAACLLLISGGLL